jgi:DNA-directed RNA polymerase specialized sigma24 family protein
VPLEPDRAGPAGGEYLPPVPLRQVSTTRFPDTRISVLAALRTGDPASRSEAVDLLVRAYRAPVLAALSWKWNLQPADAEDLVQDFFATAIEKEWLTRFDPAKARFRTFLRMTAHRFAANAHQAAGRLKRGGAVESTPIDVLDLPGTDGDADADAHFRAVWVKSVFELALAALRAEAEADDRQVHLALFEAYDVADIPDENRPTYAQLGERHALSDSQVINHLAWARRRFRSHVLDVLRRLAGSEAEYREDVRDLLGIAAP